MINLPVLLTESLDCTVYIFNQLSNEKYFQHAQQKQQEI